MAGEYYTMEVVSCGYKAVGLGPAPVRSSDVDLFDDCLIHARLL